MFWSKSFYYTKEQIQDKCLQILSLALIYWRANNILICHLKQVYLLGSSDKKKFFQIKKICEDSLCTFATTQWRLFWFGFVFFLGVCVVLDLAIELGKKLFKWCHQKYCLLNPSQRWHRTTGKSFEIFISSICPIMVQKLW